MGVFESVYMPTYRPATARRYRELHAQRVMALFGDMRLEDIGPDQYRAFAAALHKDGVQTKGPLTLVRTVVRAAHENGYLDKVPDFPSGLVVTSRKLPDAPSSEEVDAMLEAPGWLGLAIALAAMAGMRMGEVRALEVSDVDFERHRILVRRAMSEETSLTPKSGHEREVPLAAGLEARLREAVKDKLPRAGVLLDDEGPDAATAAGAPPVQALPAQERLEGALVSLAPPLLHLGADEVRGERRGRARSGRSLEAGDDPALRPCRDGRSPGRHRQAGQVGLRSQRRGLRAGQLVRQRTPRPSRFRCFSRQILMLCRGGGI